MDRSENIDKNSLIKLDAVYSHGLLATTYNNNKFKLLNLIIDKIRLKEPTKDSEGVEPSEIL